MELGGILPAALSELGQLRSLYLVRDGNEIAKFATPQLPAGGPYLDALQQLTLEPHVAESSLPALAGATKLQSLTLCGQLRSGLAHVAVAAWAGAHASLRQLAVFEWPVPDRTRQADGQMRCDRFDILRVGRAMRCGACLGAAARANRAWQPQPRLFNHAPPRPGLPSATTGSGAWTRAGRRCKSGWSASSCGPPWL